MSDKKKILFLLVITVLMGLCVALCENRIVNKDTSFLSRSKSYRLRSLDQNIIMNSPMRTSFIDRSEILRQSVNGYREQTYWGSEHSLDQRIEDFDVKEFSNFIENEVKSKDVDLYWGAEY